MLPTIFTIKNFGKDIMKFGLKRRVLFEKAQPKQLCCFCLVNATFTCEYCLMKVCDNHTMYGGTYEERIVLCDVCLMQGVKSIAKDISNNLKSKNEIRFKKGSFI
jgi:hypothetical protein